MGHLAWHCRPEIRKKKKNKEESIKLAKRKAYFCQRNVKNPLLAVMKEKLLVRWKGVVELVWIQGKVRSKICFRTKQDQEYILFRRGNDGAV